MDEAEPGPYSFLIFICTTLFREFDLASVGGIAVILLLLVVSALISGSEVALFSLGQSQLESMKNSGKSNDNRVSRLMERPRRTLATILIANNFVNVAIVILSAFVLHTMINGEDFPVVAYILEVFVITFLLLLFGEIMPKIYATRKAVAFAHFMSGPLIFMGYLFHPLAWVLVYSTGFIDKRIARRSYNISRDDLTDAIEITSAEEEASDDERKILKGIVTFGDIEVKEIMRARIHVTAVATDFSYKDLLELINDTKYSRIPAYEEGFDKVKGILVIKDLLPHLRKEDFDWTSVLRPALFVPENKKIDDLLREFQDKKSHMAIVVDEYGGTSGIITLEDILEEIVGEISDEYDDEEDGFEHEIVDENTWLFEGKVLLNDLYKILDLPPDYFGEVRGESDTLAGLLLEITGEMPVMGQVIDHPPFEFHVEAADRRHIKRIRVIRNEERKHEEPED